MVTIMESLSLDNSRLTKDIELLTEYVRFTLARVICNQEIIDETRTVTVKQPYRQKLKKLLRVISKINPGFIPSCKIQIQLLEYYNV